MMDQRIKKVMRSIYKVLGSADYFGSHLHTLQRHAVTGICIAIRLYSHLSYMIWLNTPLLVSPTLLVIVAFQARET